MLILFSWQIRADQGQTSKAKAQTLAQDRRHLSKLVRHPDRQVPTIVYFQRRT